MHPLERIMNRLKQHQKAGRVTLSLDYLIEMVDKEMRKGEERCNK